MTAAIRIGVALGTRPEAIKLAPVILSLRNSSKVNVRILVTGQHREQLASALRAFHLVPDCNLDTMTQNQSLGALASKILSRAPTLLRNENLDYLVVQGDTMSTFCMAFAAFIEQIPVAHVEAGLRSHNLREPFPEEAARCLTSVISDLDLAPTPAARVNLEKEGRSRDQIVVTGQTAVEAVVRIAKASSLPDRLHSRRLVTVTMHRRENWPIIGELAQVLAVIAKGHPDLLFVFPVHMNPLVRKAVWPPLSHIRNVVLSEPLEYPDMVAVMAASELIITDSGGLQEEGMSLGVPVAVLRNVTERPEGLVAGGVQLVGNDPGHVRIALSRLLDHPEELTGMRNRPNPYGDDRSGGRAAQAILWRLGLADRPLEWAPGAVNS